MKNKEQIYDDAIAPLMNQIIAVCEEHKIAMIASFDIPTEADGSLRCTSSVGDEAGVPADHLRIRSILGAY